MPVPIHRKEILSSSPRCNRSFLNLRPSNLVLVAGPWVGEFGWELFGWQGHLRYLSNFFDSVIAYSRPEMEYLYKDFVSDFRAYTPKGPGTGGWKSNFERTPPNVIERDFGYADKSNISYLDGRFRIGYEMNRPEDSHKRFFNQEFVAYGRQDKSLSYDVVVHSRRTGKNHSSHRNGWSRDKWSSYLYELIEVLGYKVVCIGVSSCADSYTLCDSLLDVDLEKSCNALRSSKCIVGPSSGPIHLASLCKCPQVVWSGEDRNKPKYENFWNPFSVKCEYIHDDDWDPTIDSVVSSTKELVENG